MKNPFGEDKPRCWICEYPVRGVVSFAVYANSRKEAEAAIANGDYGEEGYQHRWAGKAKVKREDKPRKRR